MNNMPVYKLVRRVLPQPIKTFRKFAKQTILNVRYGCCSATNGVISRVREKNLTYLDKNALRELVKVVITNERHQIKGSIIEAGCALGRSAIVIAGSKAVERPFHVYKEFGRT